MTQILSEDYINKKIYLHPDTVITGVDPALLHKEHRQRRRLNANGERNFSPMVTFRGYEPIGSGVFTPRLTVLSSLVRIVPYDTVHSLKIKNKVVCIDDSIADQAVFDRLNVLSNVDIDIDYDPVEIVQVSTGSVFTPEELELLTSLTASKVWAYTRV